LNFNWREIYSGGFLIRVFIYNTLIALGLTLAGSLAQETFMLRDLTANFIFSHSIGWWLAIPLQFIAKNSEGITPIKIALLVFFTLLVSGAIGAMSAYWLIFRVLFTNLPHWPPLTALLVNLILAFFFGILAFIYFNMRNNLEKTISKLKRKEIEETRLIQLQKSAELDALRARIDPHFLFNTFNSIASLIRINPDAAEAMVEKLSGLFRFSLRSSDRRFVELDEELNIVRNYLEIEKLRFGDRLAFFLECPEHLKSAPVPPLIIQPLIENSIKHGIAKMKNGGVVRVTCMEKDKFLVISVTDNGPGFKPGQINDGYGLRSVKDRLNLLYHTAHSFTIESNPSPRITMRLPLNIGAGHAV